MKAHDLNIGVICKPTLEFFKLLKWERQLLLVHPSMLSDLVIIGKADWLSV